MQYRAVANGAELHVGTVLSIATKSCSAGDTIAIEFPNHGHVLGKVLSASSNEIEAEIGSATWRLRPHAPSDGQAHSDMTSTDATFWTLQTKL